jgi:hypothetical protein
MVFIQDNNSEDTYLTTNALPYVNGANEEPKMTPVLIALAIACVVFWRLAARILAIVAVFLLVTGIAVVIQYLQHMAK